MVPAPNDVRVNWWRLTLLNLNDNLLVKAKDVKITKYYLKSIRLIVSNNNQLFYIDFGCKIILDGGLEIKNNL